MAHLSRQVESKAESRRKLTGCNSDRLGPVCFGERAFPAVAGSSRWATEALCNTNRTTLDLSSAANRHVQG